MKKILFVIAACSFLLIMSCATTMLPAGNPDEVSLNTAIRETAGRMEKRLAPGTKIALINFSSPSQAFSEYVLDELSSVLVNNGVLVVVDRANLDKIRQELGFNLSGEVSEKSMQEMGQILGAQALVTGTLTSIADLRRVMFKVIMTETATVVVQHPADIAYDSRVRALLAQGGGSGGVVYGGQNGGAGQSGTANNAGGAQTVQVSTRQTGAQNGVYTFWPRLRPMRAGLPADNIFVAKITATKDFIVIHLTRNENSPLIDGDLQHGISGFYYKENFRLQDLDNPSQVYEPVSAQCTSNGMGRILTLSYDRFSATRFKLNCGPYGETPPYVFEEIVFGEPDA